MARRRLGWLLALLLASLVLALPALGQYQPPHSGPGPAADTLRFRAIHQDIASAELRAGKIDLYQYSLKTEAAKKLAGTQGVRIYEAPATNLSLILNPAPAPSGELNPFSLREVRFALQYLIDREFVAREIFKGMARPMLTHVSPLEFDYLTIYDLLRDRPITYNPDLARGMLTKAMTGAGAVLKDGVWHYKDKPVRLKFIIRVEDERRDVGDLVRVELEKMGFSVAPVYHMFAPAVLTVYGTDPKLFEWHLYTEGWGRGAAERYDSSTLNQMTAPWMGNMPGWQEVGYWQYEHPRLDQLGQRVFKGDFTSVQERNGLYEEATRLALEESVRLWIATVINAFPAGGDLQGVTQDIAAGPKALWTLREAYLPGKKELTIGSLWVWTERTTWNPVGGFGDIYSVDIWRQVYDPPLARHPFTGVPRPFRAAYQVETAGPGGKLPVPSDAFLWDAARGEFRPVASGTQAASKVTFDYSKYYSSVWHHGQPITPADLLYSIYQAFDLAYNPEKSKVEFALAHTSRPYLETFRGFRLMGESKLEVYVDYWHFLPDYIAEYASPAGLSMPWEVLAAMDNLVFRERRAAYSNTAAERFGVPWLNLVMEKDARLVRRTLMDFNERGFLPAKALGVGGKALATQEEAGRRYKAALSWFDQYGLMVISNGPFSLVRFDPAAQYAELKAFRERSYPFKPGDWYFGSTPGVSLARVSAPPLAIGAQGKVEAELQGPGQLGLQFLLMDPGRGRLVKSGQAQRTGPTTFTITFSPLETGELSAGLYHLYLAAYSDVVSSVTERRVDIEVGPPGGVAPPAPPGGPTPPPAAPPPARVGFPTALLVGAAAALAAAAGALLLLRRRPPKAS